MAQVSTRPRYAFMLLTLIAEVAGPDGSAGPTVRQGGALVSLRDWLCDALTPMGHRDPRRQALAERVRGELARADRLPADPQEAAAAIESELRDRVRASGKTNLSRAVSELVGAGLLRRHYQGYAVDHHNRGAQRQAVYTLLGLSRTLIAGRGSRRGHADVAPTVQASPDDAGAGCGSRRTLGAGPSAGGKATNDGRSGDSADTNRATGICKATRQGEFVFTP